MISSQELEDIINKWKRILSEDKSILEMKMNGQRNRQVDQSVVSRNLKEQAIVSDSEKENVSANEQSKTGIYNLEKNKIKQGHENIVFVKKGDSASNDDFLRAPLSLQNGNGKLTLHQKQLDETQKRINKNLLPIDVRECEKERFAKLCENSQSKFGKHETEKSFPFIHCDNILNSKNDRSKSVPCISEREKEIRRLAELFENSTTSRTRIEGQGLDWKPRTIVSSDIHIDDESRRNESYVNSINRQICTSTLHEDSSYSNASSNVNTLAVPTVCMSAPVSSSILPSSKNVLTGYGEYDDKRKQLIEQRKKDYCEYMHQARLQMLNVHPENSQSNHVSTRNVAVQTDYTCIEGAFDRPSYILDNNNCLFSNNINGENKTYKSTSTSVPISPIHSEESPSKSLRVDASNARMDQYIYGEQLKKQIEEKRRLEAKKKEKEKHEEEAMERRFREQQENLRKQFEIEEAQRLTLRRHVHDYKSHQRLTDGETRGVQYNYVNYGKKHRPTVLPCSNITPFLCPDDRLLPLLEKKDKLQQKNISNTPMMRSTINNTEKISMATNDISRTAEQGTIVLNREPSKPVNLNRSNSHSVNSNNESIEQVGPLHGVDLLADNIDMIDRTGGINMINDQNHSVSPPVPAVRTKLRLNPNTQLLEDKWQVPVVEKTYIRPTVSYHYPKPVQLLQSDLSNDVISDSSNENNNNNCNGFRSGRSNNVLTQLGSFRRQLQLQHLKLQDKLYNQQMGSVQNNQENIKTPVSVATSTM